jgi:hypothetical protein
MTQPTARIEDVWAAKGNLPDNAIVATADGKYPALDGSLITGVVKTATFTLEPKRSTSLTFEDLGIVANFSESAGGDMNGIAFDATYLQHQLGQSAQIAVWDATPPEDAGQQVAAARYSWAISGAPTDSRFYESVSGGATPVLKSDDFLSTAQSFAVTSTTAKYLTQQHRGDYVIAQGASNKTAIATLNLEAGRDHYLEYDILCFYANGGPAFDPELLLTSATAGMDVQLSITAVNETTIHNTASQWRAGWAARSWDISAASNYNSTYTSFGTINSELGFADGRAYSIRYTVKARLNCTETTVCTLNYYNSSGANDSLVDVMSFRFQ